MPAFRLGSFRVRSKPDFRAQSTDSIVVDAPTLERGEGVSRQVVPPVPPMRALQQRPARPSCGVAFLPCYAVVKLSMAGATYEHEKWVARRRRFDIRSAPV